jgi:hypothetical protein
LNLTTTTLPLKFPSSIPKTLIIHLLLSSGIGGDERKLHRREAPQQPDTTEKRVGVAAM